MFIIELNRSLARMRQDEDPALREAGTYWAAALGALLTAQDSPTPSAILHKAHLFMTAGLEAFEDAGAQVLPRGFEEMRDALERHLFPEIV